MAAPFSQIAAIQIVISGSPKAILGELYCRIGSKSNIDGVGLRILSLNGFEDPSNLVWLFVSMFYPPTPFSSTNGVLCIPLSPPGGGLVDARPRQIRIFRGFVKGIIAF